ncbi:diguanylate cyclase [Thermomonas sp.]|uniref:sensor domain-containing diguanylate cyclase n=1 Tax=Thermomonas sp. TaxID=1971895 RepID=UPI0039E58DA5
MLAALSVLVVLGMTLLWLVRADAPLNAEVPVIVQSTPFVQGEPVHGRIPMADVAGGARVANLRFNLPKGFPGHWVLWLPRDPVESLRLDGLDAAGRPWQEELPGFFTPSKGDDFAPAGHVFLLPVSKVGPQSFQLTIGPGVDAVTTPRVMSVDSALQLTARQMVFASALYAAWITLLVTSLSLYWAVRDDLFLMHAIHALTALLFAATIQGHVYDLTGLAALGVLGVRWFWMSMALFSVAGLWLMLRFAEVGNSASRVVRSLPKLLLLTAVPLLLALVPLRAILPLLQFVTTLAWVAAALAGLVATVDAARRGIPMAMATAVALLALFVSAIAQLAMIRGLLDDSMLTRNGYQFALVLASLVIFVGMSSRVGVVRRKLVDETTARLESEERLRREQVRTSLLRSLQGVLRDAPEDRIASVALRLLGGHAGQLLGTDEGLVVAERCWGQEQLFVQAVARPTDTARAVQMSRPVVHGCAMERAPKQVSLARDGHADRYLVVPIRVASPGWAALVLPSRIDVTDADRQVLAEMASAAVQHLEEARANLNLRRSAESDELTGCMNRAALDRRLAAEFTASHAGHPLSLLFIDLDYFKKINDTHGHACGDECLRQVAKMLQAGLRAEDVLGRYGGEEFLILLPGLDAAAARIVGERLRQAVERAPLRWQGETLRLTISVGLGAWRQTDESAGQLLARADKALYRAKDEGRNRICAASTYAD